MTGVLYLDAFYEDTDVYMPERLHLARLRQPDPGPLQLRLMRPFMRRMYRRMLAVWPAQVREALIKRHLSAQWWQAGVRERSNLPEVAAELQYGGDLADAPTIVMTPIGIDPGLRLLMPGRAQREMTEGRRRTQKAVADAVSRGEQPDAVLQAIRDLLGMVRE